MNKKLLLVPTVAVAGAMAAGSIAYACTAVQGTTSVKFGTNTTACTSNAIPQTAPECAINLTSSRKMLATASNVPVTGPNGTSISYRLWFLNNKVRDADLTGGTCMSDIDAKHPHIKTNDSSGNVGDAVAPDSSGNIAETERYIPTSIGHGYLWLDQNLTHSAVHNSTASVCWMDDGMVYAARDVTVVVTGGLTTGS